MKKTSVENLVYVVHQVNHKRKRRSDPSLFFFFSFVLIVYCSSGPSMGQDQCGIYGLVIFLDLCLFCLVFFPCCLGSVSILFYPILNSVVGGGDCGGILCLVSQHLGVVVLRLVSHHFCEVCWKNIFLYFFIAEYYPCCTLKWCRSLRAWLCKVVQKWLNSKFVYTPTSLKLWYLLNFSLTEVSVELTPTNPAGSNTQNIRIVGLY